MAGPSALVPASVWYVSCCIFNWSCKTASLIAPGATPALLTLAQFAACVCLGYCWLSFQKFGALTAPSRLLRAAFPHDANFIVAVTQIGLGLVVANLAMMVALDSVSVALFQTCKAASPVITVAVCVMKGHRYSMATFASLVPMTVGFYMAAASTDANEISALGLAGCLVSSLAQVFVNMRSKTVYTQRYTYDALTTKSQGSTEQQRNEGRAVQPVELQFAISAAAGLFTAGVGGCAQLLQDSATVSAAATEGDLSVGRGSTWLLGCVVAVNGVLYWTESICACMCNNRVSPLPYAVLDSVRRLAIVTSSFFLYGRQPTPMNIAGIVMVLSGALIYVWTLAQVKSAASTSTSASAMAKKQK